MDGQWVKDRAASTWAVVVGMGVFLLGSGCMTIEEMAPPVGVEFKTVAARHGVEVETLELGRRVYLSDCVKCHSVEPIGRYSVEKWRSMLPKMSDKTLLDGERARALETYVTMAHVVLAELAKSESENAGNRDLPSGESVVDGYSVQEGGGG